ITFLHLQSLVRTFYLCSATHFYCHILEAWRSRLGSHPLLFALPESPCRGKPLDFMFVIDSSRSVRPHDYEKVKTFIINILRFLDVGPEATRVGLIQYGSVVQSEFSLKAFQRKADVEEAVRNMVHLATGTMTGLALQYTMNVALSEAEGARPLDGSTFLHRICLIYDPLPTTWCQDDLFKLAQTSAVNWGKGINRSVISTDLHCNHELGSPTTVHVLLVKIKYFHLTYMLFISCLSLTSAGKNLCAVTDHRCEHMCINTPGSYMCRCKKGYTLNPDGKTCKAQDLCAVVDHGCQHYCVSLPGSYECRCRGGYQLREDGKTCSRIDYCALGTHGCEHDCVNTVDSYICRCRRGFILNSDGKTCRREDLCALGTHGCDHKCVNTADSYVCRCRQGYRLNPDGKTCKEIDHCSLGTHGCDHECVNTEDSFVCRCHEGYMLNPDGKTCKRVINCAGSNHGFTAMALVPECRQSFVCQCYERHLFSDELKTCSRMDYCATVANGCEHLCLNTDSSYICQCFEGYTLNDDGKTCRIRDVCQTIAHGCEHICVSTEDSYTCKCFEGYTLAEDRKSCRPASGCAEGVIDLVFVIDGSKSLGPTNFELVKQFVAGIVGSLDVSPAAARVGLLQYSTKVRTEFTLGQHRSGQEVKEAVSRVSYMGRGSMTGSALRHMFENSFSTREGARPASAQVPKVSIVFTDGRSQDDVSEWAAKAQEAGITMYAVGVGKAIEEELREIASEPKEKHLYYAEDFGHMGEIAEKLKARICEGTRAVAGCLKNIKASLQTNLAIFCCNTKHCFSAPLNVLFLTEKPSGEDQCKCDNLIAFQNQAREQMRKLILILEKMMQRLESLENRLGYN
uniref:Matrilin 2 n=1 Tax=Lepisosteus oculatus TaxID=7918 RepID=W5MUH5_LEPOC